MHVILTGIAQEVGQNEKYTSCDEKNTLLMKKMHNEIDITVTVKIISSISR